MFPAPIPEPLRLPDTGLSGSGPVRYTKYTARNPHKCDDCVWCAWEADQDGKPVLLARQARHKRVQKDSPDTLLCTEHATLRQEAEARRGR